MVGFLPKTETVMCNINLSVSTHYILSSLYQSIWPGFHDTFSHTQIKDYLLYTHCVHILSITPPRLIDLLPLWECDLSAFLTTASVVVKEFTTMLCSFSLSFSSINELCRIQVSIRDNKHTFIKQICISEKRFL